MHSAGTIWNMANSAQARSDFEKRKGEELLFNQLKRHHKELDNNSTEQDRLKVINKITGALSTLTFSESVSRKLGKFVGCTELLFQILQSFADNQPIMDNFFICAKQSSYSGCESGYYSN